jgi:uncharacterized protein
VILLALSDIHSKTDSLRKIAADIAAADAVLLAGDITDFGGAAEMSAVLDEVQAYGKPVFAVAGNCDRPEAAAALAKTKCSLDGVVVNVKGIPAVGIGGSLPCPGTTPNEFSEEKFGRRLSGNPFAPLSPRSFIFVAHQPPFGTALDKALKIKHVGSGEIRKFVELKQPPLCICGHIHESRGVDAIGESRLVNPGAFKQGNYAMIEIGEMKVRNISLRSV